MIFITINELPVFNLCEITNHNLINREITYHKQYKLMYKYTKFSVSKFAIETNR